MLSDKLPTFEQFSEEDSESSEALVVPERNINVQLQKFLRNIGLHPGTTEFQKVYTEMVEEIKDALKNQEVIVR